jgi:uncharacterized protein Veg
MVKRKVTPDTIDQIRSSIELHLGERVRIRANKGRRRVEEREGTLEDAYPRLFTVQLGEDQHYRRVSFTYADILTEVVELTVCGGQGGEDLQVGAG